MDYKSRPSSVWRLAKRQHGVVARHQLLELGLHSQAITHRIGKGRLHPVCRGVYAVGRPQVSVYGRWMAAVLACGPDALLSHTTAGDLWQVLPARRTIEISTTQRTGRQPRGVVLHRRTALTAKDVTKHEDIPVTTPTCTLIDLA